MARAFEFGGQGDIDEVAGHRDVVGMVLADIPHDRFKGLGAVNGMPASPPIQVAE